MTKSSSPFNQAAVSSLSGTASAQKDHPPLKHEKLLFDAVVKSDASKVVELLENESLDVDWVDHEQGGRTALHAATEAGNSVIVAMLLGKGADVCVRDAQGRTPLHLALECAGDDIAPEEEGGGKAKKKKRKNAEEIVLLMANKAMASLERLKNRADAATHGAGSSVEDDFEQLLTQRFLHEYTRLYRHQPAAASLRQQHRDTSPLVSPRRTLQNAAAAAAAAATGDDRLAVTGLLLSTVEQPEQRQQQQQQQQQGRPRQQQMAVGAATPSSPFQTFFPRKSVITELLTISHFQTIYNIFIAVFLISLVNTLVFNFYDSGQPLDFKLLIWAFTGWHHAAWMWCAVMTLSCSAYILERFIVVRLVSPAVCYYIYAAVLVLMHVATIKLVWFFELRLAAATTVMCELTRLSMKMHSYLMVNRLLRLSKEAGDDDPSVKVYPANVTFANFFEFLWMPCLVYQTSYPRNDKTNWRFAFLCLAEAFMCILYIYAVFDRYCLPNLHEMVSSYPGLILGFFKLMLPGIALSMLAFYMLLHSWMNAFAEFTRFADRRFYSDWWNARSWAAYYRKWNIVVHNFIHRHIFMECIVSWRMGKHAAMWFTFIFSAVVHEMIIAVVLGFYKPILFLMFVVPGVLFIYLTKNSVKDSSFWNIFFWAMLIIGHGMLIALYRRAWHFRYNVPGFKDESWVGLVWVI